MKRLILLTLVIMMGLTPLLNAKKLQDYPAIGTGIAVDADLLRIEDMSAAAGSRTKKILLSSLITYIYGDNRTMSGTLTMGANEISGDNFDINGGTISGVTSVQAGVIRADNITIDGNTISSNTNGDINISPGGTGEVVIAAGNLSYAGTAITATGAEINSLHGLTASRVAQIDANGKLEASNVIPPVLAFLDATSSVQTQLNAKAATVHTHASPLTLTSGGYGTVLSTYALSATGTSISGQPDFKIDVNIPKGAVIVGAALRVDSILSTSASAAYSAGGSAQSIGSITAAQDSKLETFFDVNTDTPITSNVTFITITADAEVNFDDSTGSITVVVYYQWITPMNDVGV